MKCPHCGKSFEVVTAADKIFKHLSENEFADVKTLSEIAGVSKSRVTTILKKHSLFATERPMVELFGGLSTRYWRIAERQRTEEEYDRLRGRYDRHETIKRRLDTEKRRREFRALNILQPHIDKIAEDAFSEKLEISVGDHILFDCNLGLAARKLKIDFIVGRHNGGFVTFLTSVVDGKLIGEIHKICTPEQSKTAERFY